MLSVKLRIGHADGRVEERELGPGSYSIGREEAEIVLPDAGVSARHAELEVQPERVLITDAGSRNGTFDPSGRRLSAAYTLVPDQPVRLGAVTLTLVRSTGQPGAARAPSEAPAARRTRVMVEAPPQFATLHSAHATPPRTSRWIKLIGVSVVLLLGFVSLKTCTALVEAVTNGRE
ncbi:MAG: FHA domain-containing protein [Deltaproteobacteria bacterium]